MKLLVERYENYPRISELGMCMLFTHSERTSMGCNRFWAYKHMQGYKTEGFSKNLTYGSIWHSWVEHLLYKMGDHITFDKVSSEMNRGVHISIVSTHLEDSNLDALVYDEVYSEFISRIENATQGWVDNWVRNISGKYRLIAVEQLLVAPILDNLGYQFTSDERFIKFQEDGKEYYRLARSSEIHESVEFNVPWFKVGKADAIVQDLRSGDLWIIDHKTTASPSSYRSKLSFDMQLPSYCSLLQYELDHGCFHSLQSDKVAGYMWDICHSKIPDPPKPLKSGKLSKAKLVASWQYLKAIEENDLNVEDYIDHLEKCREQKDSELFGIEYGWISEDDMNRSRAEDFAVAKLISEKRSKLVRMAPNCKRSFDTIALRYSLCDRWGKCQFGSNCIANTPLDVIQYKQVPHLRWEITENHNQKENNVC